MYLKRLQIQHFRSLYDVHLEFKPLTIFIGPNASGKSNLFKALCLLHRAVAGDRLEWQAYGNQVDDLLWYGLDEYGNRPAEMAFQCEFGDSDSVLARYEVVLQRDDYLEIKGEGLEVALPSEQELSPFFERHERKVYRYIGRRGKRLKRRYVLQARSPQTPTLRDEGPDLRLPQARAVYQHISGWRLFDVALPQARQDAFIPQYPEEVPPLGSDGANLSAFLYALWRLRPDDFDMITETLADLVSLPEKLMVEHDADRGGQSARYVLIERPFGEARPIPPRSISDGTIRLLAHLALLLGDTSVSLACLEEPDHGLHPRLMLHLADVLRQAAVPLPDEDSRTPQILVTTHNPEFMDCFDLGEEQEYLQVYIADRDELGRTVLTPAAAEEFAPWLERYRLGEAVRRRFV